MNQNTGEANTDVRQCWSVKNRRVEIDRETHQTPDIKYGIDFISGVFCVRQYTA